MRQLPKSLARIRTQTYVRVLAPSGAADAAKQEVKNAATDAAGKKLRGIFKH